MVHFYNFWIQKRRFFYGFWIQKLHHFYNSEIFWSVFSISISRNRRILYYLDTETALFLQFLDSHFITSFMGTGSNIGETGNFYLQYG